MRPPQPICLASISEELVSSASYWEHAREFSYIMETGLNLDLKAEIVTFLEKRQRENKSPNLGLFKGVHLAKQLREKQDEVMSVIFAGKFGSSVETTPTELDIKFLWKSYDFCLELIQSGANNFPLRSWAGITPKRQNDFKNWIGIRSVALVHTEREIMKDKVTNKKEPIPNPFERRRHLSLIKKEEVEQSDLLEWEKRDLLASAPDIWRYSETAHEFIIDWAKGDHELTAMFSNWLKLQRPEDYPDVTAGRDRRSQSEKPYDFSASLNRLNAVRFTRLKKNGLKTPTIKEIGYSRQKLLLMAARRTSRGFARFMTPPSLDVG